MCEGMGISTMPSHAASAASVNPGPSAPNTRQQSPRKSACDGMVEIPMPSHMNSLNVAVATGVFLYEATRQRG
jgi:hypothetical protein